MRWAFSEPPTPSPYTEGVAAYYEGRSPKDNPHPEYLGGEIQEDYLGWQRGWFTAYQANLNDPTKGRIAHWC